MGGGVSLDRNPGNMMDLMVDLHTNLVNNRGSSNSNWGNMCISSMGNSRSSIGMMGNNRGSMGNNRGGMGNNRGGMGNNRCGIGSMSNSWGSVGSMGNSRGSNSMSSRVNSSYQT